MLEILDNQYQLDRELGQGATARVYLAHDLVLGTEVALKQMQISPGLSPTEFQHLSSRFLQEGSTLQRLSHPHIPKAFAVGKWQSTPAIAMEFIPGQKLYTYIQTQPLLKDLLLRLAEIADALHHAHSQRVVHRDIKPDNIMLSPDKGAFLMDFGVARQEESVHKTSDGTMLGTIAYMAPEQLYNSAKADARSDIYSLGVVMYEVLTGQLPFDGCSPAEVILKIFNSEPTHPSSVLPELHPTLADLIMNCLHKEPQERIQTAKQISYMLQAIAYEISIDMSLPYDLNRTQVVTRRPSEPLESKNTLGELEGLRLSKEKLIQEADKPDLQLKLGADGSFNQYGLLLALEQAIHEGFTGAMKIKAKNPLSLGFWFKGVIWFKNGCLLHAQLIREHLTPREDLEELIQTEEGQFQKTANTPVPLESFASENSQTLLQTLAEKFGVEWHEKTKPWPMEQLA